MCLGLGLAFVAYAKAAMVLAFIGFPFCFGLIFLIWMHTWCFLWWPVFFSYYIIRGLLYGVPCRLKLIAEACGLLKSSLLALLSDSRRNPAQDRSPQMASLSTQAAWVAASAASAAGVDAGWLLVAQVQFQPRPPRASHACSDLCFGLTSVLVCFFCSRISHPRPLVRPR